MIKIDCNVKEKHFLNFLMRFHTFNRQFDREIAYFVVEIVDQNRIFAQNFCSKIEFLFQNQNFCSRNGFFKKRIFAQKSNFLIKI
jgi:hypothetical protein